MHLLCPSDIRFSIFNRRHLAIIVGPKLEPFLWKNFRSLLCTGIDVYVMLDEAFNSSSLTRGDEFRERERQSVRSYTHRFLHISDELLEKYGVSYMTKFPLTKYSPWDRVIVWLYHRPHLTNAWIIDYAVQWFHVENMTYLFDLYASDQTDVLCADIIRSDATFWMNWPKNASDIFPKHLWLGTYSPLVRWSRRLLLHHYKYMKLMHKDRLQYDIHFDFRFKEFIMGTIANMESLSVGLYNERYHFIQLSLEKYNDTAILSLLQEEKHIIYPVLHDSILTRYRIQDIAQMMISNKNSVFSQNQVIKEQKKDVQLNQTHA